jgi:hypothetical protein
MNLPLLYLVLENDDLMAALRWALADGVYLSFNQKYL